MASADYKIEKDGVSYTPDELREYYKKRGGADLKSGAMPSWEWKDPRSAVIPEVWSSKVTESYKKATIAPRMPLTVGMPRREDIMIAIVKACLPDPGAGREWRVNTGHDLFKFSQRFGIRLTDHTTKDVWDAQFMIADEAIDKDGFVDLLKHHVTGAVKQLVVKIAEKQTGGSNVHRETQGPYDQEYRAAEYVRKSAASSSSLRSSDDHWDAARFGAGILGQHQPQSYEPAGSGLSDSAGGGDFAGGGGGDVY